MCESEQIGETFGTWSAVLSGHRVGRCSIRYAKLQYRYDHKLLRGVRAVTGVTVVFAIFGTHPLPKLKEMRACLRTRTVTREWFRDKSIAIFAVPVFNQGLAPGVISYITMASDAG